MYKRGNSMLAIIAIVFVVAIGGAALYLFSNNSSESSTLPTPHSAMKEDADMMKDDPTPQDASLGARYVMYSKVGYESISDSRHLLFFYANWCPTCRPVDTEIQNNLDKVPEDLTIVRVNYNDTETDADEKALAEKHNITYQHTFVLLENGEEVTRWNGGDLSDILSRTN